jgi:hypothetical protein
LRSVDLCSFTPVLFVEDRQQDDAPSGRDVVADALSATATVEAQLAQLTAKLSRVRFPKQDALLLEERDVIVGLRLLGCG